MKNFSSIQNSHRYRGIIFLAGTTIVILPLLIVVLFFSREETHMFINRLNTPVFDQIMKYWTYFGDGLLLFIASLVMLFASVRFALAGFIGFAGGGLLAQFFKLVLFSEMARPVKYFKLNYPDYVLHLVDGVNMHGWHSFPSGHTATAFAFFYALSLFTKNRWLQSIYFILALGVAISRVYLSQHFLMDIVGGAILGTLAGWLTYRLLSRLKYDWLDKSLKEIIRP